MTENNAYKMAGVDIDAADALIDRIKPLAKMTARSGADASLGGFGGAFDLKATGYNDPILVSGTDGVGTKLRLAIETGHHSTIGIDLVAMCVNDVLAQGAEPLFFLDYFATGKLDTGIAEAVIAGIANGCKEAGCALIGGETAEMPGMYEPGDYDLAGFCVGAVERDAMLPRQAKSGDIMIGIASSGAHSNGYSLIRKVIHDSKADLSAPSPFDAKTTLGAALLEPTRLYIKSVLPLLKHDYVRGFAHITGGGLTDNVPRVLEQGLSPVYDDAALSFPPLFEWLSSVGNIGKEDMRRTFNCGIGGVLIVDEAFADTAITNLQQSGEQASIIGHLTA